MNTDTPRTDALVERDRPSYCHYRVYARMVTLARELERDLNLVRKLRADESRDSRAIFEKLETVSKELKKEQIRSDGRMMLLHGQEARHKEEVDKLSDELETERIRLAACGVIAMADTVGSRDEARKMHPDYKSASAYDVARRVDECIDLRERLERTTVVARNALYELERLYRTADTHALPQIIQNLKQFLP